MKRWGALWGPLVCIIEGTGRWGLGWLQSWGSLRSRSGPPAVCPQQGASSPWGASGGWGLQSHQLHKKELFSPRSQPLPDFSYKDSRQQQAFLTKGHLCTEILRDIMLNSSSLSNQLPWEIESKPVGTSCSVCSSFREGKTASRDPSKVSKAAWRCKGKRERKQKRWHLHLVNDLF